MHISAAGEVPPAGASVIVEAHDTSLADAPSRVVARGRGVVRATKDVLASVSLALDALPSDCTIWAHIDVDGDGRISVGDFITMESFPLRAAVDEITIRVRRVAS